MTEEISELQSRRADNIIWTSAGDYSFTPDFKAFDADGKAELYWNIIIGSVRRHYDYSEIEQLLYGVQPYEESDLYEGILWLAIESAVFQKEKLYRPVLEALRKRYAKAFIRDTNIPPQPFSGFDSVRLADSISLAYWKNAIGAEQKLSEADAALIRELSVSGELSTSELIEQLRKLLEKWFLITAEQKKKARKAGTFPDSEKRS